MRCPVCLVFAVQEAVVRWASGPIELGGGSVFAPLVIGASGVPVVTRRAHRPGPERSVPCFDMAAVSA
jgi:hypothetical protein